MTSQRTLSNPALLEQIRSLVGEGHPVTLRVKGYSMRPFLEHGRDKVVLAPAIGVQPGDAVLAKVGPECYVLHRVIRRCGNSLTLMGDGNVRGTEQCTMEDVIAVATTYIYPGRSLPANDASLCRRIRWWNRLRPIRRYLLYIYRLTLSTENTSTNT